MEWSFGTLQVKAKLEGGFFEVQQAGQKSKWPAKAVMLGYEGSFMPGTAKLVIYAGGTIAKKLNIPKGEKSEKIIDEISTQIAALP